MQKSDLKFTGILKVSTSLLYRRKIRRLLISPVKNIRRLKFKRFFCHLVDEFSTEKVLKLSD